MHRIIEYVDVRGPHPIYIHGQFATILRGAPRDITVKEARRLSEEE